MLLQPGPYQKSCAMELRACRLTSQCVSIAEASGSPSCQVGGGIFGLSYYKQGATTEDSSAAPVWANLWPGEPFTVCTSHQRWPRLHHADCFSEEISRVGVCESVQSVRLCPDVLHPILQGCSSAATAACAAKPRLCTEDFWRVQVKSCNGSGGSLKARDTSGVDAVTGSRGFCCNLLLFQADMPQTMTPAASTVTRCLVPWSARAWR